MLTPCKITVDYDRSILADFDCGNEPWACYAAEWIQGSGVTNSMDRGTVVWIYFLIDDVVGFGSVGHARWSFPEPQLKRKKFSVIPQLGIDVRYQGKPDGPKTERYSSQIMDHLLLQCYDHVDTEYIVLEVQRENTKAEKLYTSYSFTKSDKNIVRKFGAVDITFHRMYLRKAGE